MHIFHKWEAASVSHYKETLPELVEYLKDGVGEWKTRVLYSCTVPECAGRKVDVFRGQWELEDFTGEAPAVPPHQHAEVEKWAGDQPAWWNRLHEIWTWAVGKPGYNKEAWHDLEVTLWAAANVRRNSYLENSAADEPVFVLCARDMTAPYTVIGWADKAEHQGVREGKVAGARAIADAMLAWQRAHPEKVKLPD